MNKTVDIIIPLQDGGSEHGDLELRYLLRSICENASGVGNVFVATNAPPEWLAYGHESCFFLPAWDVYKQNKDGNIFGKVLAGLMQSPAEEVIFTADDCVVLKPIDLATMPVTHSLNGHNDRLWKTRSHWHERMRRTFDYVHSRTGEWLPVMYDSHVPTRLNRRKAIEAIEACRPLWDVEGPDAGININTAIVPFAMPDGVTETVRWGLWKTAFEKPGWVKDLGDKTFATWNDTGWDCGVAKLLAARFPTPCKYER